MKAKLVAGVVVAAAGIVGAVLGFTGAIPWWVGQFLLLAGLIVGALTIWVTLRGGAAVADRHFAEHGAAGTARILRLEPKTGSARLTLELTVPGRPVSQHTYVTFTNDLTALEGTLPCLATTEDPPNVQLVVRGNERLTLIPQAR